MKSKLVKVDLTNKKIFVGLDVHKSTWHATIIYEEVMDTKSFIADSRKFSEYLKKNYPGATFKVGYEAGCFGYWIKEQLEAEGIETIVINAADIPTTDKDKRNKTDKVDSRKIAMAIKHGYIEGIYTPDRKAQEDRSLIRRREDLSRKSTRIKNQIKAILKFYGIVYPEEYEETSKHWSKKFIEWLHSIEFRTKEGKFMMEGLIKELLFIRTEILLTTRQIRELSKSEHYKEQYQILKKIPGIGLMSAMTILTEVVDIFRFKNKDEFISYLGLSPTEHSSGMSRKMGHMSKRCNYRLRTIYIESSWVAIRKDPALMLYYNESYKKIGNKPKAIIKVAKKLAVRTRYLLMSKNEYMIGIVA
jgi:transposase